MMKNPISSKGGKAVLKKKGRAHFQMLGRLSAKARADAKLAAESSTKKKIVSRAKKLITK